MDRFIVTNDRDRKILQDLRQKVGCKFDCGIFQVKSHARYGVHAPPCPGIETVASVLHIEDDLVFNCLVDNCKIDQRALSRSKEESERLLLVREGNGRESIRGHVNEVCFLPNGDKWSVRNGSRSMVSNEKPLRGSIGVDTSAALQAKAKDEQAAKAELQELKREENRLEHEHTEHQRTWNKKKRAAVNIHKEIDQLKNKIEKLKADQDTAVTIDNDTSEYENDISEAQQTLEQLESKQKDLEDEIQQKQPAVQEIKARLEETKTRNNRVLKDMNDAHERLQSFLVNLTQWQEKIESNREKVKKLEDILVKHGEKIDELASESEAYLNTAKKLTFHRQLREEHEKKQKEREEKGEAVEPADASEDLDRDPTEEDLQAVEIMDVEQEPRYFTDRIRKAEAKIKRERERQAMSNETPAAVYERLVRAKNILNGKLEKIAEIDKTRKEIHQDIKIRRRRWKQFRSHISRITGTKFGEILNMKGSAGSLEFDDREHTLDLIVQKDANDENTQQSDVKALSGGERSYATIALLIALGESLETPFRILDEFDVFLDPVTRKLTIDHLITMAKGMRHRQFIFITPQDVSNVQGDSMLTIHKMNPPDRNQIAGAPVQQTLNF